MTLTDQTTTGLPRDLTANPRLSRWIGVTAEGRIALRVGKVELGRGILPAFRQVATEEFAGTVSCLRDERRTSYAELAGSVDLDLDRDVDSAVAVPRTVGRQLVGTSAARPDLPDKVAGRPCYISDLTLPGMLFGRVVRPTVPGARLVAVGDVFSGRAELQVVRDMSFLGVVGPDELQVARAAAELRDATEWDEQDTLPAESEVSAYLLRGPHEDIPVLAEDVGVTASTRRVTEQYSRPFPAHASIGTSCGLARATEALSCGATARHPQAPRRRRPDARARRRGGHRGTRRERDRSHRVT